MTPSSFEERFDKRFPESVAKAGGNFAPLTSYVRDELKAFIKSELDKRDGEWIKMIKNAPTIAISPGLSSNIGIDWIKRDDLLRSKT